MKFGPMTEFDLNKLKELLDFTGAEYHVDVSKDDLDLQNGVETRYTNWDSTN